MIKLSDYVMNVLVENGVKHLFLLPGGACMHLVDSVEKTKGLEFIACLHEQAAAFGAEASAEYGNTLGAALVTAGPGGTNAITGLAAAWIESAPVIFLSGQAKRADLIGSRGVRSMGQQEVDIVPIVKPITKYAVQITDEKSIRFHLEKAIHLALTGRPGPVWLDIPLDVQARQIEPDQLEGFRAPVEETSNLTSDDIEKFLALLQNAERPVIYAGNGIRLAGALGPFRQFIDLLGAPVLTSWKAADLLAEDDPLYCGRPGAIGQRGANFTQQNADLIIVLGARLDLPSVAFNHEGFARHAKKVFVDIDPSELGKFSMKIDLSLACDARVFLAKVVERLAKVSLPIWKPWLDRAKGWQRTYPVVLPEYEKQAHGVSTYAFYDVMSDLADASDVLIPGSSGPCSDIFMQAFKVKAGQRIFNAPGLGAMGTGLPASIGACVASGRKRTLCFNGDGGFQLNIQELETVRRLALPIKFFIFSNGGYGSIFAMQKGHFQGHMVATHPESGLTLPDIRKVAAAYGIPSARISTLSEVRDIVPNALSAPGPFLCEIVASLEERTAPRVTSIVHSDGTITSNPMEDMAPLLSREEFKAQMLIPSGE
jgi:acetolactate synthase I/II/III large subunit